MNVMRRLKSFASSRSSISSDHGEDSGTKRAEVDQESEFSQPKGSNSFENSSSGLDQHMASTSSESVPSSSNAASVNVTEKSGFHRQTSGHDDKDAGDNVINGNGTEAGQIITTVVGGRSGHSKQTISYMAESVVGTGSFGVVFQAKCFESGESVAIKKVLQDKRYKNRELQVMHLLDHPNTVRLKHYFFSSTDTNELYLNLVLEYIPETVFRVSRQYFRLNRPMPMLYVQLYIYQLCRGLNYLHHVVGVCHRDIKPQNLLVNPYTHQLRALDLLSRLLQYSPNLRGTAMEACAHPFFDDLRDPAACLPNGRALPPLFNFTDQELAGASNVLFPNMQGHKDRMRRH